MTHLLTEQEASTILGLSVRTLQKWRLQGDGPRFLKLGNAVRYDPEDLEDYVESARRHSTSDAGRRPETSTRVPRRQLELAGPGGRRPDRPKNSATTTATGRTVRSPSRTAHGKVGWSFW